MINYEYYSLSFRMDLSIFVARTAAIAYISIGISVLGKQVDLKKMIESFENSQGLTIIVGFFSLIIGMLLVAYHNLWVKDWSVIITILGWAALLKGVLYLAFPKQMFSFKSLLNNSEKWGYLILVIGLIFGYFGFMV